MTNKIDSKMNKMRFSVSDTMRNPSSKMYCDKCHKYLGLWHMLRCALFVKKGGEYVVCCKSCKKKNIRVKGEMGEKIDRTWEKYGY